MEFSEGNSKEFHSSQEQVMKRPRGQSSLGSKNDPVSLKAQR